MNVLYFLVPLALLLAASGVWAFVWSVKNGQFEDVETPGLRVLFEEPEPATPPTDRPSGKASSGNASSANAASISASSDSTPEDPASV